MLASLSSQVESGRIGLFVEGDQHHNKIPLMQVRPIASKNNTTDLQRLQQF